METILQEKINIDDIIISISDRGIVESLYHVKGFVKYKSNYIKCYESYNYTGEFDVDYANARWVTGTLFKFPNCLSFLGENQKERANDLYKNLLESTIYKKEIRSKKINKIL